MAKKYDKIGSFPKNRSLWTRAHLAPQRSKEYMNFEKCPQISENKLQWHYFICVCR